MRTVFKAQPVVDDTKEREGAQAQRVPPRCVVRSGTPATSLEFDFLRACILGRVATVERLIVVAGVDVNASDSGDYTGFHHACLNGQVGVVRALLQHEAVPNALSVEGRTPFYLACVGGHVDVLATLAQHPSVDYVRDFTSPSCGRQRAYRRRPLAQYWDDHGMLPLHACLGACQLKVLQWLLADERLELHRCARAACMLASPAKWACLRRASDQVLALQVHGQPMRQRAIIASPRHHKLALALVATLIRVPHVSLSLTEDMLPPDADPASPTTALLRASIARTRRWHRRRCCLLLRVMRDSAGAIFVAPPPFPR